jgi:hypothetical protein
MGTRLSKAYSLTCFPGSSVVERLFKRISFYIDRNTSLGWPLGSTKFPRFLSYYGPSDACSEPRRIRHRPPRFLDQSFGTCCPQPPRRVQRLLWSVASPLMLGFITSGRLTTLDLRNEAESGSLALRLAPSSVQSFIE